MNSEALERYKKAISRMRDGSITKKVAECYYKHRVLGIKTADIAKELGIKREQATRSRWALMSVYGFELITGYGKSFRLSDVTLKQSNEYLAAKDSLNKRRFEQRRKDGKRLRGESNAVKHECKELKRNELIRSVF